MYQQERELYEFYSNHLNQKIMENQKVTQAEIDRRNVKAIGNLLTRQANSADYDAALDEIYKAKKMIVLLNQNWPNSKSYISIELQPIDLHLLEDLMHDLGGECKGFVGTLKFEGGTIKITTK